MKWGITVMRSKTSFINKGILHNDFKRFTWIGIAYLLGLFLSIPLQILMLYSRGKELGISYDLLTYLRVFHFDSSPFQFMLLIIVPVLTGLVLFRYLQVNRAADMEHTLPIKRETMYNTHIVAGLILLLVPLVITALICWALVTGLGIQINNLAILSWLSVGMLVNILLFMTSVAVGMFTGMSTVQGLLSYILLLLPSGFSMLLLYNLKIYIYGFAIDVYSEKIAHLSPLIRMAEYSGMPLNSTEVMVYLLCSIALYFIGKYLYRRRRLEMAGNAITFDIIAPVLKYSVTFCSMLLVGVYFQHAQNSMGWTYFGYFLGAVLGYFLTEILLNKSWHVFGWKQLKGCGIYGMIIVLMLGLLHFDCTGYEKRLPALDQVESIYLDNSFWALIYNDDPNPIYRQAYRGGFRPLPVFVDSAIQNNIHTLHKQIIANIGKKNAVSVGRKRNIPGERICLAYKLKDGSYIYRQYTITTDKYAEQLKPIYESPEFKKLHYEILSINPGKVNRLEINAREGNKQVRITDPELIRQGIIVLQKDIYEQSFAEMVDQRSPWAEIEVYFNNQYSCGVRWNKSYANFEQWLKSTGKYDQARLMPEDISYAIVAKGPDQEHKNPREPQAVKPEPTSIQELETRSGVIKITASDQLESCLRIYQDIYPDNGEYTIMFQLKNGGVISGTFSETDVPDFIQEHF